jgi:two-component system response regulator DesR
VIRILLAEDQELVRTALATLLDLEDDFVVVATVGRGDEVLAAVREADPTVALVDIEMPGLDGLSVAAKLRDQHPACKVIILTTFGRPGYLRRAMEAGASGFVVKDAPAATLGSAIRSVVNGTVVVDPALAGSALAVGTSPLTPRETEVLAAARGGTPVGEIADRLYLSEGTVRNYLSSAIAKTGARNREGAVDRAEELGWI